MSLVLAFGLSPLGQVPAYADNGKTTVAAQSTIKPQAGPDIATALEPVISDLTYSGAAVTSASLASSVTAVKTDGSGGTVAASDHSKDRYTYTVSFKNADGKAIDDTTYRIENAGTYYVVLTGDSGYSGTVEKAFKVKPVNIKELAEATSPQATFELAEALTDKSTKYSGSAIPISLKTNKATYGSKTDATLVANQDFVYDPKSLLDATTTTVYIEGTGNFTGRVNVGLANIAQNDFSTVASVMGQAASASVTISKALSAADADPAATGKVKAGDTPLTKGGDYTVKYKGRSTTRYAESESAPDAPGTYTATITGVGYNFTSNNNVVTVDYSIADENTASKASFSNATFFDGEAVVPGVKFLSAGDKDVTASVGANGYDITACAPWTAAKEKELLGDDANYEQFPYEDYENTAAAAKLASTDFTFSAVDPDPNDGITQTGKNAISGLVAGDYEVEVTPAGGSPIKAKLTVDPATAKIALEAGALQVTQKAAAAYTGEDIETATTPILMKMVKTTKMDAGELKVDAYTAASNTKAFSEAAEDFKVEYLKGGSVVTPKDVGKYDARITFASDDIAGSVTVEDALEVTKATLFNGNDSSTDEKSLVVKTVTVNGGNHAVYTTGTIEPEFKFENAKSIDITDKLSAGDFTVTYRPAGDGAELKANADGKMVPWTAGTYDMTFEGAGNYQGKTTVQFVVDKVDYASIGNTLVVQFLQDDGVTYNTDYRAAGAAGTPVEPKGFRVVTADTMFDEHPTEIPSSLYTYAYSGNRDGKGTAKLNLTPADDKNVAQKAGSADFYITAGAFPAGSTITLSEPTAEYAAKTIKLSGNASDNPDVKAVVKAGSTLDCGTDYKIVVTNPKGEEIADAATAGIKDAGTYKVTVKGGSNLMYSGEFSTEFKVTAAELKQADASGTTGKRLEVTANATQEYTGKKLSGVTAVKFNADKTTGTATKNAGEDGGDITLVEGADYELKGNEATDANESGKKYTATIEFKGNYAGSVTQEYEVTPKDISKVTNAYSIYVGESPLKVASGISGLGGTATAYAADYNGKAQEPELSVWDTSTPAKPKKVEDIQVTPLYDAKTNVDAGATNVTVVAAGNYTGRLTDSFDIKGYDISERRIAVSWENDDLTYTGKAIEPKGTITYTMKDGTVLPLEYGTDYVIKEYTGDNVNVGGKAAAEIVGLGNFYNAHPANPVVQGSTPGKISKAFEIAKGKQEVTASASKTSLTVGETAQISASATGKGAISYAASNGNVTVSDSGLVTAVAPGTATVTVTAAGDDNVEAATATVDFTVAAATPAEPAVNPADPSVNPAPTVVTAANPITVKAKTAKVKYSKVKKKKQTLAVSKVLTVKGAQGKLTYTKKSGNKKITVNKTTGKVTVKKGLKKGTYKVKVAVKAAGQTVGTTAYAAKTVTKTFKVKVK